VAENDVKDGAETPAAAPAERPAQASQGGGGGNRGGPGGNRGGHNRDEGDGDGLQDRVVHIARVAKVVKGGRRFSFSALVVVGDGKSKVGYGLGKAGEVPDAIRKASDQAKKNMFSIPNFEGTIPFDVVGKYGACSVVMNPAVKGKGLIAGGAVRIITELAGIRDIVCKVHGTRTSGSVVRATIDGLMQLQTIETYATSKGVDPASAQQKRATKQQIKAQLRSATK
jgi:small subunit ribosomal protein S5